MRPIFARSALLIAFVLTLPAAEVTVSADGTAVAAEAQPADAKPEAEPDAPADPVTELRQHFTQLIQDRPVLAKTDSLARFDKAIAQVVAAQAAVTTAAALDGDGSKRTQLTAQKTFDQRLLALEQLVIETELTADLADAKDKIDAHPGVAAKDDVSKRLIAVREQLLATFAKQNAAQNEAKRLRHQADGFELDAEEFDAKAEQRAHVAEQAAEDFGKINEMEGKAAHAQELAATRTRQLAAIRSVHEAQTEALHQRQEAELIRLQADAIDDQWEQIHELFDAQRETLGQVNESIDQAVEALAQAGADK